MNIYYDVNHRLVNEDGLIQLGELDEADLSYEFNMLCVVKHEPTGRIFYATDAGCSCPIPFESYYFKGPDDTNLVEIKFGDSWESFQREVEDFPATRSEKDELLIEVKAALKSCEG